MPMVLTYRALSCLEELNLRDPTPARATRTKTIKISKEATPMVVTRKDTITNR